ncbi:hypothetical protein EMPS_10941 [Entomortierella parvispora]|uniref:alpha-1,2-Mannosidase n=1 Tax=Entomortierella parvispora TaxID=205924 RepID=A0A9P3HKZ1_9FUNG|nr:hypothetical protein EMPS_10941 [Entomortierella parvispora]
MGSSPPPKGSSFVVDIEQGLSPSSKDEYPEIHRPSPSASPSYPKSASPVVAPLAGLKRLIDRNPATVINGRYSINIRQFIALILLILTFVGLWFGARSNKFWSDETDNLGISGSKAHKTIYTHHIGHSDQSVPDILGKAQRAAERLARIQGKGTNTSLKKIQFDFPEETEAERFTREKRLQRVKDGFVHAWKGYKENAWGQDEVVPVRGGAKNNFNGWGATMVDSLDTLVIMGMNDEFDEALEWVRTKFDMTRNPTAQLQFFETVIRYLGGFLSAYDLTGEQVLLDKAEELGNILLNAFGNRVFPAGRVAVQKSASPGAYNFCTAEIGTIQLEFTRLSMLTKNPIYDQKGQEIFKMLGQQTSELPGMLPSYVREGAGQYYSGFRATVGGMIDSYYEYLLKEWILLDGSSSAATYKQMFLTVVDTIKEYMVSRPDNGGDYAIIGAVQSSSKTIDPEMEHLSCFIAGSLAMGAKYFDRPEDLTLAKQVAEGCYQGYHNSATGLGPEVMKFDAVPGTNGKKFVVNPNGFFKNSNSYYILRPETLESLWILYRITGEKKYQDQVWEIFESLERSCRTNIAYSGLSNVNSVGSHDNKMESFFMAETMKYIYLTFAEPNVISLDQFVFNTEAHPLRRT